LNLFAPIKNSALSIHGLIRGDRTQKIDGDKHTHGLVYMTTGWVPIPMVNAMPEGDKANAKQITAKTASIDQQMLTLFPEIFVKRPTDTAPTQFPSIQLAGSPHSMMSSGSFTCLKVLSYSDHDKPLGGESRSQTAFNNIFGMAMGGGTVDPVVFQRQQMQKKSILQFVQSDIQRLLPTLPVSQRPKLDAHLSSIRNLEANISLTPPVGGKVVKPTLQAEPAGAYEPKAHTVLDNNLDIIRCALQSDLTRVASFTAGHGNNADQVHNYFTPPSFAFRGDGHGCSHNGKSADAMLAKGEVSALFLGAVAKMFANMAAVQEAGGTLLDNTLGTVYTECEDGDPHSEWFPLLVAGAKWMNLKGGQHMVTPDRYVNDFWLAAINKLGNPMTVWGDPQYSKGVFPGVFG
jgi:hypothetical protein